MVRKKQTLPKSLSREEFKKLIKATPEKDKTAKVAFLLGFGAGMRVSEVINLKQSDFRGKTIFISQAKYSKDRVVPLPKGWKSWMLQHIPINKTARSLQRNFKSAAKVASLRDELTFHSLRHGFANRLMEAGVPLSHIQLLLGHSNISTTNVYTRANPIKALESYEELF